MYLSRLHLQLVELKLLKSQQFLRRTTAKSIIVHRMDEFCPKIYRFYSQWKKSHLKIDLFSVFKTYYERRRVEVKNVRLNFSIFSIRVLNIIYLLCSHLFVLRAFFYCLVFSFFPAGRGKRERRARVKTRKWTGWESRRHHGCRIVKTSSEEIRQLWASTKHLIAFFSCLQSIFFVIKLLRQELNSQISTCFCTDLVFSFLVQNVACSEVLWFSVLCSI